MTEQLHKDLSGEIIGAFYRVYNTLRFGFLEKVYENAMAMELGILGLQFQQQAEVSVLYKGIKIGYYRADFVIENKIVVELKMAESICSEHEAQLLNYLRASDLEVGLLLNFGKDARFKRKIFQNHRKHSC